MVHAEQGFTANLPLADLDRDDVLFAYQATARTSSRARLAAALVVPHLYFWKSAKWVRGLEFLDRDEPGFWERTAITCAATPGRKSATIGSSVILRSSRSTA